MSLLKAAREGKDVLLRDVKVMTGGMSCRTRLACHAVLQGKVSSRIPVADQVPTTAFLGWHGPPVAFGRQLLGSTAGPKVQLLSCLLLCSTKHCIVERGVPRLAVGLWWTPKDKGCFATPSAPSFFCFSLLEAGPAVHACALTV